MRLSVIIAAHNEGEKLWKTIESCVQTCCSLDHEIVVSDDGSTDGSIEDALSRFPRARIVRSDERRGASPAKASGADAARGETFVFLDGHCKPEPSAIERLVSSVELLSGRAIVTPRVASLCTKTWRTKPDQIGSGYYLKLDTFDCGWLAESQMAEKSEKGRTFFESPTLIGCALAVSRELYDRLGGFDPHMRLWGVEDIDLGLRCWLLGSRILHDPAAVVAHRFQSSFESCSATSENLLANMLRMARKNFTHSVWVDWVEQCRVRSDGLLAEHPEGLWARAWTIFEGDGSSVEADRALTQMRRVRDEFWYATRFGLAWPVLATSVSPTGRPQRPRLGSTFAMAADPSPSPSPPPPDCDDCSLRWAVGSDITNISRNVLPGAQINLAVFCESGTPRDFQWSVPGSILRSYEITQQHATRHPLIPPDYRHQSIQFFWTDVGDGRQVSVSFRLNGRICTKTATFNVKDPCVRFPTIAGVNFSTPPIGNVQLDPAPPAVPSQVWLLSSPGGSPFGVVFKASVERPEGFGFRPAQWFFGQIVNGVREWKDSATGDCFANYMGSVYVNDDPWPYNTDATPSAPPYMDGSRVYSVADSPFQPLADKSRIFGQNSYKMYIMFKPAPDPPGAGESAWVPLRSATWSTYWCAENLGNWELFTSPPTSNPWVVDRTPPMWGAKYTTLPDTPIPAIAPCS